MKRVKKRNEVDATSAAGHQHSFNSFSSCCCWSSIQFNAFIRGAHFPQWIIKFEMEWKHESAAFVIKWIRSFLFNHSLFILLPQLLIARFISFHRFNIYSEQIYLNQLNIIGNKLLKQCYKPFQPSFSMNVCYFNECGVWKKQH